MPVFDILFAIAVAVIANSAAQIICHRSLFRGRLVPSLIAGFLFGAMTLAAGLVIPLQMDSVPPDDDIWAHSAAAVLIYLSASFTFLCLVAASETSVRFQILRELGGSPTGLTLAELDEIYSNSALMHTRLNRLLASGAIRIKNDGYHLSSQPLLIVAVAFRTCKWLLFGVTNEFNLPNKRARS